MADLTITEVTPVEVKQQFTGPAGEAIAVGNRCRFDTTTGKLMKGNGTTAAEVKRGGIATHAAAAGQALTVVNQGIVDVGEALAALDFGADIYVSDTDGAFGTAGTDATVDVICGMVVPGWGSTAADKLLWLFGD
jgi:hypothetical protein